MESLMEAYDGAGFMSRAYGAGNGNNGSEKFGSHFALHKKWLSRKLKKESAH